MEEALLIGGPADGKRLSLPPPTPLTVRVLSTEGVDVVYRRVWGPVWACDRDARKWKLRFEVNPKAPGGDTTVNTALRAAMARQAPNADPRTYWLTIERLPNGFARYELYALEHADYRADDRAED